MDRVKAYLAAKHNADKSVISAVHCLSVDSVYIMTIFVLGSLLQTGEEDGRHQSWPGDLSWAVRGELQRWQPAASRSPVCSLQ